MLWSGPVPPAARLHRKEGGLLNVGKPPCCHVTPEPGRSWAPEEKASVRCNRTPEGFQSVTVSARSARPKALSSDRMSPPTASSMDPCLTRRIGTRTTPA